MIDWSILQKALRPGSANEARLRQLQETESWLSLPLEEALAAIARQPSQQLRQIFANLSLLRFKLRRDAGAPLTPDCPDSLPALLQAIERGEASPEQQIAVQKMRLSLQLSQALHQQHPGLDAPPSAAEAELRRRIAVLVDKVQELSARFSPGLASAEIAAGYEDCLRDFLSLAEAFAEENPAQADLPFYLGHTAWDLVRALIPLRRYEEAQQWLPKAELWFEAAGRSRDADDCRNLSRELADHLRGDLDTATEAALQALVLPVQPESPLRRADDLLSLSAENSAAGDFFEANRNAEEACRELLRQGYPDPEAEGLDAACNAWIATARQSCQGPALELLLTAILRDYATVLGARVSACMKSDPERSARLEALFRALTSLSEELFRQSAAVEEEILRELAVYLPESLPPRSPEPEPPGPQSDRLFDELLEVQNECNRRTAAGQPCDDLLERARTLQTEADLLRLPALSARARLLRSYLNLQMGHAAETLLAAVEAQEVLLQERPPTLASLTESAERSYYLEARSRMAMAHIMAKDFAAALRCCDETVRDVELERERVSTPYQQSAWIGAAADSYSWGAFAAFRLQDWDKLLSFSDLLKARVALRLSMPDANAADPRIAALVAEFQSLQREQDRAADPGDRNAPADPALAVKRRRLWELIALLQAKGRSCPLPELTLSELQQALAPDEAVIGYFWVTPSTPLLMVLSGEEFHAEILPLAPAQLQLLSDLIATLRTMKSLFRGLDPFIAKLGEALLPPLCRQRIAAKKRLIFVPHRRLHLFPFHAVPWDDEPLGLRFAVRYAPNLASLLLPWQGIHNGATLSIGIRDCQAPGYPPLTNAEEEARDIGEIYREQSIPADLLLGDKATRENLQALPLQNYRVVHLSTHGESVFQNVGDPLESKLMLCGEALDAMEIPHLGLHPELVVLSACSSGQRALLGRDDAELAGDDIFGLQMAFFQAGVGAILGALWSVETTVASQIVTAFHRHFASGLVAELALQQSLREFWRQQPNQRQCCFWAPFFLNSIRNLQKEPMECLN
jgi:hypothetical protein